MSTSTIERLAEDTARVEAERKRAAQSDKPRNKRIHVRNTALSVHGKYRGLVRWQSQFWWWRDGAYHPLLDEEVKAQIYRFLWGRDGDTKRTDVADVLDAVRAHTLIDNDLTPPCWLPDGSPQRPGTVATASGIVDMLTGEIEPSTPKLFTLSALPVAYDPAKTCPGWLRFIDQLWPDEPDSQALLQEWFGYLVSTETMLQKLLLMIGPKRAGKGTILRIIGALMGRANTTSPTLESLTKEFGLQPLIGKTAALVSDARLGRRSDQDAIAERILSITGEDSVSIPRKHIVDYDGPLQVRFTLATNELPRVQDVSGALASRFEVLTLSQSFYDKEDLGLTDRLLTELPGILNWALVGYRRLKKAGRFTVPASSADAVQQLQDLGSPTSVFIRDECVIEPDAYISRTELYQAWCDWCKENGRIKPGTSESFGRDLRAAAPKVSASQPRVNGKRVRRHVGIRLADSTYD